MNKTIVAALTALPIALGGASAAVAVAEEPKSAEQGDIIARVGDQAISFNQLNTMLNSSAVVGVSVPALGTPERDTARIVVLDKVISANLLYLDAKRQGLDKDPVYQRDMRNFSNGMLAGEYQRRFMASEITVSDEEIQAFFAETMVADTEMTDDLHTQIEATLRKRKLHERLKAQRQELTAEDPAGLMVVLAQQADQRARRWQADHPQQGRERPLPQQHRRPLQGKSRRHEPGSVRRRDERAGGGRSVAIDQK